MKSLSEFSFIYQNMYFKDYVLNLIGCQQNSVSSLAAHSYTSRSPESLPITSSIFSTADLIQLHNSSFVRSGLP